MRSWSCTYNRDALPGGGGAFGVSVGVGFGVGVGGGGPGTKCAGSRTAGVGQTSHFHRTGDRRLHELASAADAADQYAALRLGAGSHLAGSSWVPARFAAASLAHA